LFVRKMPLSKAIHKSGLNWVKGIAKGHSSDRGSAIDNDDLDIEKKKHIRTSHQCRSR